jgi:murein DD-endopeptidase MepM/ murein hydrolase activator NlpD
LVELRNRHRHLHHFSPVKLKIRGLLWPVNGKIIESFGRYHDGVDIAAAAGSPVKSAETGRILFARHYSGYGKLVIVNHGHHVYSLYGHMKSIGVKEGQIIRKGGFLGTAGGGGTNGHSTIFFGLTHFGNPVNPLPYLGKRRE